jgi:hypothetical protein
MGLFKKESKGLEQITEAEILGADSVDIGGKHPIRNTIATGLAIVSMGLAVSEYNKAKAGLIDYNWVKGFSDDFVNFMETKVGGWELVNNSKYLTAIKEDLTEFVRKMPERYIERHPEQNPNLSLNYSMDFRAYDPVKKEQGLKNIADVISSFKDVHVMREDSSKIPTEAVNIAKQIYNNLGEPRNIVGLQIADLDGDGGTVRFYFYNTAIADPERRGSSALYYIGSKKDFYQLIKETENNFPDVSKYPLFSDPTKIE